MAARIPRLTLIRSILTGIAVLTAGGCNLCHKKGCSSSSASPCCAAPQPCCEQGGPAQAYYGAPAPAGGCCNGR